MFGAKYSRLKFWIVSICLLIPAVISNVFVRVLETSENNQNGIFIFLIVFFQKKSKLNNFENEMEKLILNSVIKEKKLDWSFVTDEDPIDMISAIKLDLRRLQEMEYE